MSNEEKNEEILLKKSPTRYGWIDFSVNLVFSIIMIASFIVFIFIEKPEDSSILVTVIVVTVFPFLIFGNRTLKEMLYKRDYISIESTMILFRSTPLFFTGLRVKKGEFPIHEIRRYGMIKIPRKFSLDLWKYKTKAMIVFSLRDGRDFLIGEYIDNEDLVEICLTIKNIYPKARFRTDLSKEYPDLAKKEKEISAKTKKKEKDLKEEPKGTIYRRR
ncbi:MAG: hypothetical protein ACFFDS_01705 [Candidatus Thorarchaeota archaeon]